MHDNNDLVITHLLELKEQTGQLTGTMEEMNKSVRERLDRHDDRIDFHKDRIATLEKTVWTRSGLMAGLAAVVTVLSQHFLTK